MSRLVCKCGHEISLVQYPSPHESIVVTESDLEGILSQGGDVLEDLSSLSTDNRSGWIAKQFGSEYPTDATNAEIAHDVLSNLLTQRARCMVTCPSCGRLHLQSEIGASEYRAFVPEQNRPEVWDDDKRRR